MAVNLMWVEERLSCLLQEDKITIDEYNNFYDSLEEENDANSNMKEESE